ncbi:MAG TPA: hypothetical protein VK794_10825 [Steroidobacteraceae bacterium]|nr:hypothetical protein [Steroidobacteraceae bacterium]
MTFIIEVFEYCTYIQIETQLEIKLAGASRINGIRRVEADHTVA